ncbi:hypothetical protein SAY86_022511 [Trapa natans]|uniref:Exostosin GT47 domain-containing protein n=1 Tax=Trapa natans TaxID=22666 RepID=A0AAN7R9C8_TRANT|nr:hypothetical protein SAY86_022511 [Trapa natans]
MLPISGHHPCLERTRSTPSKATDSLLLDRKSSSFNSLNSPTFQQPYLSVLHPRALLFLSLLCLQVVLFVVARSLLISLSFPRGRHHFPAPLTASVPAAATADNLTAASTDTAECSSGRVYVYELPKFFNREIIEQCDNLNPWGSRCDALANDGFGPPATGLDGLVPREVAPAWFWTDQFVLEIIFHNRMLKHRCRTTDPEKARGFYIPFYAGLEVGKYLWTNSTDADRDRHCGMVLRWVQEQEYFKRSYGWDHFISMARITWDFRRTKDDDWGSSCIYLPGMRNITRLLIERNPWDYFDVGVPYPTAFHPRSDSDVIAWQDHVRTRHRNTLFCFAGATRRTINIDFRGLLLDQCREAGDSCRAVNCAGSRCLNGTSAILETFLDSKFCLQPRGDSFTRRSIFDCLVAGSIPVLFWKRTAYFQYEWFLPKEKESYSVYIDRNEVKNGTLIKEVLERFSDEDVRRMREKVIEYIPKFVYAMKEEGLEGYKDAFDVAIDGVLRRFKEQEEWGFKWR